MVEGDLRDHVVRDRHGGGRVEAAAESDFEDRGFRFVSGEVDAGGGQGSFDWRSERLDLDSDITSGA